MFITANIQKHTNIRYNIEYELQITCTRYLKRLYDFCFFFCSFVHDGTSSYRKLNIINKMMCAFGIILQIFRKYF